MRAHLQLSGMAAVVAAVSFTAPAFATGGVGGKGDTGGKGGNGPSGGGTDASERTSTDTSEQAFGSGTSPYHDTSQHETREKPWEVALTFETHRLIQDQYLTEGVGPVQTFNVLDLVGTYYVTPDDRVSIEGAAFQYFLADSGETGFRADDIGLEYSHLFRLPWALGLRAYAGATVPISFDSQLASNITAPYARLKLARIFGDLTVGISASGRAFIDRYSTANTLGSAGDMSGSGTPNPQWKAGGAISAEYDLPFHRPLIVGASATTSYVWYYAVGTCPYGTMCYGATSDPQFGNGQPVQQSYGGDVYVKYDLPDLAGFRSDVVLTLANGDPTLGYPNVLNDGVQHPYFLYYDTTEVYLALEGSY